MKSYGDVVVLALGPISVNALVAQSVVQPDGKEHLIVTYHDPDKDTSIMSGQDLYMAIKKSFPAPLEEGMKYGWKDLAAPELPTGGEPSEETGEQAGANTSAPAATDFSKALHKAGEMINQQSDLINSLRAAGAAKDEEITSLHAKLAEVENELKNTTEGIDKQLQAIADENAVKPQEAAPEATADPTGNISAPSENTSDPDQSNGQESQDSPPEQQS